MEQSLNLTNRFALILDPETIESALKRAAEWKLPRRECHPLDRCSSKRASADLDKYDAQVEAAPVADEESDAIDAIADAECRETRADFEDGGDFDPVR